MEEQYDDIKKLVREVGIDTPTPDFMQKVMNEIENASSGDSEVYQPLISKKVWIILGLGFVIVLAALAFLSDKADSVFDSYSFAVFKLNSIDFSFSGFTFYQTTTYGVLFLALLFLLQITMITRKLNKNLSLD